MFIGPKLIIERPSPRPYHARINHMDQPDTQLVSVRCNHCGAPLQIDSAARFLTCSYCGAQLEVHRSGGAVYTEVLQEIDQRTERIERDVQEIKRQNAIEALDRE